MKSKLFSILIILMSFLFYNFSKTPVEKEKSGSKKDYYSAKVVYDAFFSYPTTPFSGPVSSQVGTKYGYGGGLGIFLDSSETQFRIDVTHFEWSKNGKKYQRIPFFIGFRINLFDDSDHSLIPTFDIGLEVDNHKGFRSDNNIVYGFLSGTGLKYIVHRHFRLGVNARYHLIKYSYFSFSPYISLRI